MKIFSLIRKCLYSFFQLHSNCICKPIIVSVKITTKIFKFYSFPMYFRYFIRYMLCKLHIYQKSISTSFLNYIIILSLCLPFYLWKLAQKSSTFNIFTWISLIFQKCYTKIFSCIRKCIPFLFHLYFNCICMPCIGSEILSKTSSIFSVFLVIIYSIIHKLNVNLQY